MSKLNWDAEGERLFETGVESGVLYVKDTNGYGTGVAWNGLTQVQESPEGAEATPLYADNMKYLNLISAEDFKATVEAYTYPDEFGECNGEKTIEGVPGVTFGQQSRKMFGLAYKTKIGDDMVGDTRGYKIHLVYGCTAAPSEKAYQTTNDSPEAITFSWPLSTTPVSFVIGGTTYKTATFTIDSTTTSAAKLALIEGILFGTDSSDARLPLPEEIISIMAADADNYPVSKNLLHVVSSNKSNVATDTYATTLTAESGYTLANVTVVMNGVDVTSTAVTGGSVSIASVTGPITIFATANAD